MVDKEKDLKKNIIGEYIEKVFISEKKGYLVLQLSCCDHYVFYSCGDCCNDVYFNHCAGIENLIKSSIRSISIPDSVEYGDEKYEMNVLKIKTNKGYCDFEVRNSGGSGWDYSGSVYLDFGGFPIEDMKLLTKDF